MNIGGVNMATTTFTLQDACKLAHRAFTRGNTVATIGALFKEAGEGQVNEELFERALRIISMHKINGLDELKHDAYKDYISNPWDHDHLADGTQQDAMNAISASSSCSAPSVVNGAVQPARTPPKTRPR